MLKVFVNLILLCNLFHWIISLLKAKFSSYNDHQYHSDLRVGNPSYHYDFINLDITTPHTFILQKEQVYGQSPSTKVIHSVCFIQFHGYTNIKAIELSDQFQVGINDDLLVINNMNFYLIDGNYIQLMSNEAIGLGYNLHKSSFINQLKDKGFIESLSFSFVNLTAAYPLFYMGGIPDNITQGKHYSQCRVSKEVNEWGCQLNEIIIHQNELQMNIKIEDYAYFSTVMPLIYATEKFFNDLFVIYFNAAFLNQTCYFNMKTSFQNKISCQEDYIVNLPNITFNFDHNLYTFSSQQLFNCKYKQCNFLIVPNDNPNQLIIGVTFLKYFDILFDHDNGKIEFYSNTIQMNADNFAYTYIDIKIIIMITLLLFLLIGLAFVIKYKSMIH